MVFQSEKNLEDAVIPFLEKQFKLYSQQVPLYNRVIDFVGVDDDGNIIGIEFKLNNWKRALKQAKNNRNAFDFVYICIPNNKNIEKIIFEAKKNGVGVIIFDFISNEPRFVLQAQKVNIQWLPNYTFISDYITKSGVRLAV